MRSRYGSSPTISWISATRMSSETSGGSSTAFGCLPEFGDCAVLVEPTANDAARSVAFGERAVTLHEVTVALATEIFAPVGRRHRHGVVRARLAGDREVAGTGLLVPTIVVSDAPTLGAVGEVGDALADQATVVVAAHLPQRAIRVISPAVAVQATLFVCFVLHQTFALEVAIEFSTRPVACTGQIGRDLAQFVTGTSGSSALGPR